MSPQPLSTAELEAFTKEWDGYRDGTNSLTQTPDDVGRFLATIRGLEAENARLREALESVHIWKGKP